MPNLRGTGEHYRKRRQAVVDFDKVSVDGLMTEER